MRRENSSGRPGGDKAQRGPKPGSGRPDKSRGNKPERSRGGFRDKDERPGKKSYRDREESSGRKSYRDRDEKPGRRASSGDFERGPERPKRSGRPRFDDEKGGRKGFETGRRGQSRFETHDRESSRPKRLIIRKGRRSKGELLKELGYADHKSYRESIKRAAGAEKEPKSNLIRLNRFIANAGICSRREADKYIAAGVVKVNGQVITELGTKVSPDDEVRFDDRLITPERKVYLLLNKPKDYVTTTEDPHATQTVMDLIKDACDERIYPVGRLDRNTTGLLLLTNDGDLAKRLSHPSHNVVKVYQVTLDKVVSVNDMQKIGNGIELEDGLIAADAVSFVEGMDKNVVGLQIHSGRNRIVRRIFEHLGYRVKALDRVSYAGLTKKNIPRGKWRFLAPPEVNFLKMK